MFKRYWQFIIAVAGLAFIGVGAWYGLEKQAIYQNEAQNRHADYARYAAQQVQTGCAASRPAEFPQCVKAAITEYRLKARDNERDYADLVSQRTSALWTSIMGIAALIGMGLSAVGVALVWTTFRETKRTNRIAMRENARSTRRALQSGQDTAQALREARRSADAAERSLILTQRAVLFVKPEIKKSLDPHTNKVNGMIAHMAIENLGATEAKNVKCRLDFAFVPDIEGDDIEFATIPAISRDMIPARAAPSFFGVAQLPDHYVPLIVSKDCFIFLHGKVVYNDILTETEHHIEFCYRTIPLGKPANAEDMVLINERHGSYNRSYDVEKTQGA